MSLRRWGWGGAESYVANDKGCGSGAGVDKARIGDEEITVQRKGSVGGWGVGEASGEGAGGRDVGGDAGAGDAIPLEQG